ncbi:hypothetical protein FGA82_21270 [Pseudomonas fluorescens]|uniref:hypothetical protein n=1 Tax=Pseudomonas fluorescens TaxID=294 RepID=UPI001132404E|nr:hypothetical protein [Pseudomonas fluorescens]TMU74664.1 hypothetical protein FGA82_21270 [Pseudomonas fluorescens]
MKSNSITASEQAPFKLDDRTLEQRLTYVFEYASQIPFDASPQHNWAQVLFPGGADDIDQLVTLYTSAALADGLLAPQQAFLLALLHQLETPTALFNALADAHRQLYYRNFLGLKEREAVSDTVVLSFGLKKSATQLLLPAGTLFGAGQDAQGNLVQYQLDQPLQANQGQLSDVRWCRPVGAQMFSCVLQDIGQRVAWPQGGCRLFSAQGPAEQPVVTGRVVASDALALSEGKRTLRITFASTPAAGPMRAEVSTAKGWIALTPGNDSSFVLEADGPAITPANGLDGYMADVPLLKLSRQDGLPVPVVSSIAVKVTQTRQVRFHADAGSSPLDRACYPFGQTPQAGVSFISLMAADWCRKTTPISVTVTPQWQGLPGECFADWYQDYPNAPVGNQGFLVQPKVYTENGWETLGAPLSLFANAPGAPAGIALTLPPFSQLPAQPSESNDPEDWDSRVRLELVGQGFLQPPLTPSSITATALNPPYTPQWKSLDVEYSAVDSTLGTQYVLTPFGYTNTAEDKAAALPQLYLGFSSMQAGQHLSLYWKLQSPQPLALDVQYLNLTNQWSSLNATVVDATEGLFDSGLWTASLPADAANQASAMPAGRHWIRLVVTPPASTSDSAVSSYPWLQAVLVNCMTATLSQAQSLDSSYFDQPLPANTITQAAQPMDGLGSVVQPWPSAGGRAAESPAVFNRRVARQLAHRGRGQTWKDVRALLLAQFPEVHEVYTPTQEGALQPRASDLQTLMVIPEHGQLDNTDVLRPVFNQARLEAMRRFLQAKASPWAKLTVVNPVYINVTGKYDIQFSPSISPEYGYRLLAQKLLERYLPWAWDGHSEAIPGSRIDYYEMLAFIQRQPLVEQVVTFTLNDAMDSIECTPSQVLIPQWESLSK